MCVVCATLLCVLCSTLERPIKNGDPRGLMRLQMLMGCIALRRTKDMMVNGQPLVMLPPKTVVITPVKLRPEDQLTYDRLELQGRKIISGMLASETLLQVGSNTHTHSQMQHAHSHTTPQHRGYNQG